MKVLEKLRNKKVFAMYLLGVLLLSTGVSYAYFTLRTTTSGNGTIATGVTTTIEADGLASDGNIDFNNTSIYPGHIGVASIKVTGRGNNIPLIYNVIFEGTNTFNTPINYTVYKTSSEIEVSATCENMRGVIDGAYMYYEECSISNLEQLGSIVTEGTISTSTETTKIELIGDEFINSSPDGASVYYYVILEYPNLDESQNIDIGGTFTGEVTIEESDTEPDINIIAAYIEQEDGSYTETTDIPQSGYVINIERSTCSNGATVRWENSELITSNLTKSGTSCYLYFDVSASNVILANRTVQTRTFPTEGNTSITGTNGMGDIYSTIDYDGITYYFAGNPDDNWIYFAGFYWRIIRINGDGSIRMIYNGKTAETIGTGTQFDDTSSFNSSWNTSYYVGLKYSNSQHGIETNSVILENLNTWYEDNLLEDYAQYISIESGFCGDREMESGYL